MNPETLAEIHKAAFPNSRTWDAQEMSRLLESHLVFLVPGDVGFALGRAVAEDCELLTIAVPPSHRRKGVGFDLLEKFESEARKRGATTSFLEVAEDNEGALALYRRYGYETIAKRPNYYTRRDGEQIAACLMKKALN